MLALQSSSIGHNVARRGLIGELHSSHLLNARHKLTCIAAAHIKFMFTYRIAIVSCCWTIMSGAESQGALHCRICNRDATAAQRIACYNNRKGLLRCKKASQCRLLEICTFQCMKTGSWLLTQDNYMEGLHTTVSAFTQLLVAVHCITHDVQSQDYSALFALHQALIAEPHNQKAPQTV